MFSRLFLIPFLLLFLILISASASSATTVYTWQDASGVITFSDNPANAPGDVQVVVFSKDPTPQALSDPNFAETSEAQSTEQSAQVVTQGEFAIQLVEELGLGEEPNAEEAADILTNVLIAPRYGQWELDQPMTSELTVRLRKLTVAAAETGRIGLTPEQVLIAFDTTAAMLGLPIPAPSAPEEASESPYTINQAPPLVYMEPPPSDIYPYYVWSPVAGGFWWNHYQYPGFFVLNVNKFFFHHHGLHATHSHFSCEPFRIQHHFIGHIVDHHMTRFSGVPNPGRVQRPTVTGFRSVPASNRVLNPTMVPRPGLNPSGLHFSGTQPGRRYATPRPMMMNPPIRRQSFPAHAMNPMSTVRTPLQSFTAPRIQSSYAPRYFYPSVIRWFNGGQSSGSFGRAPGWGSSNSKTR